MGEFSISHILILSLILLIFFGPSRLPALGQSIGKAIRGFKDAMNESQTDGVHNQASSQSSQQNQQLQGQNQQPMQQNSSVKQNSSENKG